VTGKFGSADSVVSIVAMLAEALDNDITCPSGKFSGPSLGTLEILKVMMPRVTPDYESAIVQLKLLEKGYRALSAFACKVQKPTIQWTQAQMGAAVHALMITVQRSERDFFDDLASHDPTHSMLAKDHVDHPLHRIAALCAQQAVFRVGCAMYDAWRGLAPASEVIQAALAYFVHPDDTPLTGATGEYARATEQLLQVGDWAHQNPNILSVLDESTSKARFTIYSAQEKKRDIDACASVAKKR
jgi:hypothetical protein